MYGDRIVVSTPLGLLEGDKFKGMRGDDIFAFLGVPYAKPPIGERRFKDPEPVKRWTGVKDAKNSPPVSAALIPYTPGPPTLIPGCSEDCLYLNVYTPVMPNEDLNMPVMVYIHGGGFTFGSGNKEVLGPDFLVPQGIVLVAVNYRVGPFGFLSLNTPHCPGNFGLKDQTMALRWVQRNISSFGGDPDNVTLFGESAGGASVHFHLLSPLSRGLFHRAIAQSGCALNRWAISRFPRKSALLLAKRLGCESEDLEQVLDHLRKASTEDILVKSRNIFDEIEGLWAIDGVIDMGFVSTIEPSDTPNAFLTVSPQQAVDEGHYADVPLIIGCCSHEAIFCLPHKDYVPSFTTMEDFQLMLPKELAMPLGSEAMLKAAKMLMEFYFPDGTNQTKYVEAATAQFFSYGCFKVAQAHAKNSVKKAPVYFYSFNGARAEPTIKQILKLDSVPGTCHAEDLDYLFTGCQGLCKDNPIKEDTREHSIQKLLIKLWTDFAITGMSSLDWPPFTEENNFQFAELNETIKIKTGFESEQIELWDKIYDLLRKGN